ncbi:MAG: ATPase domain-containing protein [Candidatus Micrarchaeota archaeon]
MGVYTEEPRVKTGVPGLDKMLNNGFPKSSIILVAGESGSGKSTLGMQYLYFGVSHYKEPGMLISFEENKSTISKNMAGFGWDLDSMEKDRKIIVLEYPPQEVGHFMAQEVIIHDAIEEHGVKRVVIDSITTFALMYETEHKKRNEVVKLVSKLKRWGCTVILTSEVEEEPEDEIKARFGFETICDGVIYLYNTKHEGSRKREIEVYKMRGTAHDTNVAPMRFTNTGIAVG